MKLEKVWRITQTLLISQLRASSTGRSARSFIRKPRVLAVLAVSIFALASGVTYLVGRTIVQTPLVDTVRPLVSGAIITLPAIVLGITLVFGLMLEIGGGSSASSSDTINWLPITAGEYVSGSILMVLAYYSVLPALLLGATISFAYLLGLFGAWELAAILSICGMLVAASILEILRAILNRFSSSFYKKGGRSAIAVRAISGVVLILIVQILFYPTFYQRIIGTISSTLGPYWFIPVLWSSVSVASLIQGQGFISLSFALLFLCFAGALFYGAILARIRYWVPVPPSIRISNAVYTPRGSSFLGFLSPGQLAIARKDLRGLVRRREMTRFLAQPGILLIIAFVGFSSGGFSGLQYLGFIFVAVSAIFLSMAEIGSEGKSIANLYQFPLSAKDFVIGKAATPVIFDSAFAIVFFVIIAFVSNLTLLTTVFLLVTAVSLVCEMTLLGMFLGVRYPNFSDQARSSYMSTTAGLIGTPLALVLTGISLSPQFFAFFTGATFPFSAIAFAISLAMIFAIGATFYALAVRQSRKLFSQLPGHS